MAARYYNMATSDLQKLRKDTSFRSIFVEHIARICGPSCFQFADDTLQVLVIHLCQLNTSLLFKNETFLQHYTKGELFDKEHATAFGMQLGKCLLKCQRKTHEEADRFSTNWKDNLTGIEAKQRNTKNFSNDQRFSDVRVTYGIGQTIFAHKVVLAIYSPVFQIMLAGSPKNAEIDLSQEHSSVAVKVFIEDMYMFHHLDPGMDHNPSLLAELYMLAKRYGRNDMADAYLLRFGTAMFREPVSDEYLSHIAEFCGPDSSKYTETGLPEEAFVSLLDQMAELEDEKTSRSPCKALASKLKGGTLLNPVFMGRFANEMLFRHLGWDSDDD
ncbi:hypothetical protein QM012_000861 [Aureobasidium pullulans]|uniref:BTB domain-containing protein n=1 Tax=Aureobasidium pullulans TaxID=5580 RepID=A0ABR0TF06_AURPU